MEKLSFPRVLVISHNVFSKNVNVGKFLTDTFKQWPKDCLFQLYFYEETPTVEICQNYYKLTDLDIVHSILKMNKECGCILTKNDININLDCSISDELKDSKLYKFKINHESIAKFLREIAWSLGTWKSQKLDNWIKECKPDIIYFVMSDYNFPYKLVYYISNKYNIPVFTSFEDDFYFSTKPKNILDKYRFLIYKKVTHRVFELSSGVSYASEVMKRLYENYFEKKGIVQYKSAKLFNYKELNNNMVKFFYAGSLSFGRWKSLLDIGKAIECYNAKLYIYSNINDPNINLEFKKCKSICFEGYASPDQIEKEITKSDVLLVVESFELDNISRVKCSLSTKVADYIGSGKCILAYGPRDVGSIEYLRKNNAAVIADNTNLANAISMIIHDRNKIENYIKYATILAKKNHDPNIITKKLIKEFKRILENEDSTN